MTIALHQRQFIALGFDVLLDDRLGHLMVSHDGSITWDQLQAIKNAIWGEDARAIEVYPATSDVVNSGNFRHLWRLGESDFCPDLLGHSPVEAPVERGVSKEEVQALLSAVANIGSDCTAMIPEPVAVEFAKTDRDNLKNRYLEAWAEAQAVFA